MNQYENDSLAQLGEALLREFEVAEKPPVPGEFNRAWRHKLRREKKRPVLRVLGWTARAAVVAFALVGVLAVAAMSIESLRTPLLRFATVHFAPEEVWPEEPEEPQEYRLVSYMDKDNVALSVYFDGKDSYQLLLANEAGQRRYHFRSPELDEDFFQDLKEQLVAAGD